MSTDNKASAGDKSTEVCRMYRNKGSCRFKEDCKYEHSEGDPIEVPDRKDQPRGICFNHRDNGECKFGDRCRFSHGDDEAREKRRNEKKKTKKRNRRRGPKVAGETDANGGSDGQPSDNRKTPERKSAPKPATGGEAKTKFAPSLDSAGKELCRNFRNKGSCRFADECNFSHEAGGAIPEPARNRRGGGGGGGGGGGRTGGGGGGGSAPRKTAEGGDAKRAPRQRKPKGPGVCYNFQENGSCEYGDECRFRHGDNDARDLEALKPRKAPGLCYNFRDNGECQYGDKCRFSHDLNAADDGEGGDE